MNAPLPLPALADIRAFEAEMVAIRHQIHANPELAYQEHATADLVAERLARWGYEVHRGLGGTGVVGTLRVGTSGRHVGLRADMDALPIAETSGKPWASKVLGKMHACGHDGHTAMLLAAARHLAATRNFDGHPAPGVPAGRRRPGRRPQDAGGRLSRALPLRRHVRHAQHAGQARRQVRRRCRALRWPAPTPRVITVRGIGGHGAMPQVGGGPGGGRRPAS